MYFFSILSILFFLYSFIQSSELCEQNTSTTSDEVQYTSQKSINVNDISGHVIRIFKTETNHKNSNKNCEGLTLVKTDFFGISDYINKNGKVTGYSVATYSDGSKIFSTLTGNAETPKDQAKNGYVVSTIKITGGTNSYKGVYGFGKSKIEFNPETGYSSGSTDLFYGLR